MVNRPGTQLVLVDSPGVHKAKGLLHRSMVEAAMSSLSEVDVILYLAEAGWPSSDAPSAEIDVVGPFHRELLQSVMRAGKPVILVLTKIDLIPKPNLLHVMQAWNSTADFREIYPLSGLTGDNVDGIVDVVRKYLPEGAPLFAADLITDQSERALCAEYIREQVFLQTRQEIPYGTAVTIDEFDESERPLEDEAPAIPELLHEPLEADEADEEDPFAYEDEDEASEADDEPAEEIPEPPTPLGPGLVRIQATIIVERDPHKAIVIGKGGSMLKMVGQASRARMERLLGCRVWLGLHVRVIPGWTEKRAMLAELGLTA
jgi:GTP-binding protein Era